MYVDFHVKYPLFVSGCNKSRFSRNILVGIKFHENPTGGAELFMRTDRFDKAKIRFLKGMGGGRTAPPPPGGLV
jgi:hypothetical protein